MKAIEFFKRMFPNLWSRAINSGSAGDLIFVTLDDHSIVYLKYMSDTHWTMSTSEEI